MQAKPNNTTLYNWLKLCGIYLVIFIFLAIFILAQDMLTPFLIAFILVYMLTPLTDKLESFGFKRGAAVTVLFLGFIIISALLIFIFRGLIFSEIDMFKTQVPIYLTKIKTSLLENASTLEKKFPMLPKGYLAKTINDKADGIPQMLAEQVPSLVGMFIAGLTNAIVILFTVFFILKDGREIRKSIIRIVPNKYFETFLSLLHEINMQVGYYVRGQIIDCAIVAVLAIIGLNIIGLKYAFIIGLIVGVTNIIPYLGPVIGMIPAIGIAFIEHPDPVIMSVYVIITLLIVQLIDNSVVSPLAVGKSVDLHPLIVIISVILGGALMGVWGMLLAVPVFCALKVTFETLYKGIIEYGSWESN